MASTMITVKLDDSFLHEVDLFARTGGYHNRTELIRSALREKMEASKLRESLAKIAALRGSQKRRTTDEEIERVRQLVIDGWIRSSGR